MDHNDHTTNNLKGKHLTYGERVKIEIWLEEGHNPLCQDSCRRFLSKV